MGTFNSDITTPTYSVNARLRTMCRMALNIKRPKDIQRREDFTLDGFLKVDLNFCHFASRTKRRLPGELKDKEKALSTIVNESLSSVIQLKRQVRPKTDEFILFFYLDFLRTYLSEFFLLHSRKIIKGRVLSLKIHETITYRRTLK